MPTLIVNSTEYNVPEDYTIGKWSELVKWSANDNKVISIAYGLPPSVVDRMSPDTKHLALCFIVGTLYPNYKPINKNVKGSTLISFSELTLGQFIDLEVFIGRDYTKHIKEILSILYQTDVDDSWYIGDVYGALQSYFKWRITLYNSYKNLFNIQNDIVEEAQNFEGTPTDVAHVWYDTTMILADGKFLNIEPALNRPLLEALNYLAWNKTQIERQAEEIRLAKAQMK